MEVETTFVITGVVKNPRQTPEIIISLQEAIDTGLIHPASGLYLDRGRKATIPIPQAMNEGLIKVTAAAGRGVAERRQGRGRVNATH